MLSNNQLYLPADNFLVCNSATVIENARVLEIEKPGISKTRLNLTPEKIEIPETAWSKDFQLGTQGKTPLLAGLDWVRFQGEADETQWRELVMTFPSRHEEFWVNTDATVKSYPTDSGFDNCLGGEYGSKLAWRLETAQDSETGKDIKTWHWAYTVTGKGCERLGELGLQRLLVAFAKNPTAYPTRLDPFFEEYHGRLQPSHIVNAIQAKNFTGFRKYDFRCSSSNGGGLDGFTASLGSRESDRYRRIYHTGVKHGYNAMRFECEVKGDWCKAVWAKIKPVILENASLIKGFSNDKLKTYLLQMANWWGKIAVAGIDFIDTAEKRDCNGSLMKCERLPWWDKLLGFLGKTEVAIERETPSLAKTDRWLKRQVKAVLRTLYDGLGLEEFYGYVLGMIESCKEPNSKEAMDIAILRGAGKSALAIDNSQIIEETLTIGKMRNPNHTMKMVDPLF